MPSNVGVALPVGNWPQINNVADSLNLNRLGLPPSLALKEQGINRYQQLANILMQRGLTPAQGQMAGRFYVPPTWAQGAAQLGSAAAGVGLNIAGEYQRQDIADESQNILSASLQKYRDSIAPQEVQTKAADTRSVNGSGVEPGLPYGIDPHTMPSQGWDINTYQPDTTQQVQDNKNAIALNTPPPQEQEAPLQGVYHDLTQAPMLDKQPLVDALQQRYDQGEQYTRQPFSQPQSQVTVSGAESAMQERTPQQKQQALVELMASQHPQAQAIAAALQQQQAKAAENDQQERFHKDDVRLRELGINENASGRLATIQNTMAMKEMDIAQREAARQDTRALRESLEADKRELQRMQLGMEKGRLDETARHNREIEGISKMNAETKRDRQDLSPTAQKELFEADDALLAGRGVLKSFEQARALNDKAYDGFGADTRATLGTNIPGIPKEGANATVELDNIIKNQALGQLKAAFGSMPTEGERKILLEVQGSVNLGKEQRLAIWKRAEEALNRKMEFNEKKAKGLREGTYFKESPAGQPAAPAGAATGQPSIDDLLKKY
jgi:hypothetical protein